MNSECADIINDKIELCFTDSEGDEAVRICLSKETAWDVVRELRRRLRAEERK